MVVVLAAAAILARLDDDQLDILEERLADNADEYRDELDDDHKGRRLGETLKDVEEWTGSIEEDQRRMLTHELRAMTETAPMWLEWRIERNERLVALLRTSPGEGEIEDFLAGYWLRRDALPDALQAGTAENRARYRAMIVSLHASLNAEQRRHVDERLAEYIEAVVDMMPDEIRVATLADAGTRQ